MSQAHIVLRVRYIGGYEVVAVYESRKAANAEAKRLNTLPQARHLYKVKSKQIIREQK